MMSYRASGYGDAFFAPSASATSCRNECFCATSHQLGPSTSTAKMTTHPTNQHRLPTPLRKLLHHLPDAPAVVPLAAVVDLEPEVVRERLDGAVGSLAVAGGGVEVLRNDEADVVTRVGAEDLVDGEGLVSGAVWVWRVRRWVSGGGQGARACGNGGTQDAQAASQEGLSRAAQQLRRLSMRRGSIQTAPR